MGRRYAAKCLTRAEFATLEKQDVDQVVRDLPSALRELPGRSLRDVLDPVGALGVH